MHVKITIIISKEPRYKSHDTDYSAITAPRFYPLSIKGFFSPNHVLEQIGILATTADSTIVNNREGMGSFQVMDYY